MNEILKEFDFFKSLFDDCIITGKREEHLNQIKKVLETFAEFGIPVNLSKCQFMKEEVTFIGHGVQKTGILPEMSNVKEVIAFPRPSNSKEVKSFLGVAAYFRKFIRHFSDTSACLYNLLKKGVTYNWSENCETSFQLIKEQL